MFPHNSSSHEISTETNAFVQNSKGDVVVLEGSSLSGAREGERPEHARYCDIEFINSSMMAAPISHPEATAANDFLTVLPRQSGELSFAGVGEACQSVATETTKNPTNHLLTYDNNNKVNNHNNAEHNHHKYRKQNTPGSLGQQLGSSADTSKSTCKPLSDNKDSFSDVSVRVLKVSVRVVVTRGDARRPAGVPSLVRIPKSDRPQRLPRLANFVDNYSLLGSRLDHGENNNFKANLSFVSNNNNNSKSVILLSSTSYGDYYLLADGGLAGADAAIPVILVDEINTSDRSRGTKLIGDKSSTTTITNSSSTTNNNNNNTTTITTNKSTATSTSLVVTSILHNTNSRIVRSTNVQRLIDEMTRKMSLESVNHSKYDNERKDGLSRIESLSSLWRSLLLKSHFEGGVVVAVGCTSENSSSVSARARNFTAHLASSSITLIVSKNGITDHTLQSFLDNLTKVRAMSPLTTKTTSLLGHVTVSKLTQRICVPLLIKYKGYDYNNVGNNNDDVYDCHDVIVVVNDDEDCDDDGDDDDDCDYCNDNYGRKIVVGGQDDEMMNISNNNPDVIEDIVNVAVCYKTSSIMTTNISMLGSQNDGIRCTEATMFTVGALSFQDNDKSNKPLNASFKDNKYQVSTKVGLESNSAYIKSVSKSTPSDKSSDKSETSHEEARLGVTDEDEMKVEVKRVRSAVNIPTLTTCEPTMTLKCQSATVTSQTNAVPVSQVENNPNNDYDYDYDDDDDDDVHEDVEYEIIQHQQQQQPHRREIVSKRLTFVRDDKEEFSVEYIPPTDADYVHREISTVNIHNFDDNTNNTECVSTKSTRCYVDQCEKKLVLHDEIINHRDIDCKSNNDDIEAAIMSIGLTNEEYKDDDNVAEEFNDQKGQTRPFTRNWSRLIAHVRALIPAYQMAYKNNESECEIRRNELKNALSILFRMDSSQQQQKHEQFNSDPIIEYKLRWGIPTMLRLCGGGESSLNSGGGATWGSAAATTPNNNNANQSGWGGTPGNPPGSAGPPSNWGGNNVNRSVTGNPNSNQNQGPPGAQTNPGNVNKVNNPNQSGNAQTGPPTSQSSNPTQSNQNSGGQWSQGKPNSAVGPGGPNPSAQNNNGNNVPQQPTGSNANNNQVNNPAQGTVATAGTVVATNPSTKAQLEQLNTMREALFSQDGWGCQHVNQDTNWDVPASPEPALTKDGVPMWKPPVNNGTDLWEANLRNGGQPPPSQQAKTPWGHTPSTNIGGTWGEDDDAADSSNMWTGAPAPSQPNTTQWPGGGGNQAGSSWVDPRIDPRDPRDLRSVDPREMRDPRENRMTLDPRDHMRVMDPMAGRDPRMTDMRGDPRGISGRLNGANADAMWGLPPGPPHHQMGHQQHPSGGPPAKMLNPSSMNQWAAPPPKDMIPGKPSGWEEPSPPTQRRNVPNYDDGTSLWGNPAANQRAMPGTKVSHWKDLPTSNIGRGGMQCPPGMPQNRMPGQPGMKPEVGSGPMWGHPGGPGGRNGSWVDGPHDATTWDDPKTPAAWNEPQLNPATWGGPGAHKSKAMGGPGAGSWADADMDPPPSWAHPTKPALTKEVIWNSREFRYLCDLGYKKEDVEVALRTREMNKDEAQELLSQLRSLDQWRRHDAQSAYDPTSQANTAVAYPRFNHVAQQMSFPPGAGVPSGVATGSVSGSVASASLLKLQQQQQQQAAVQLQQQQPSANPPQPPFNQASRTLQNPPSTQQLRMLVQQIQLAVQEGYLNQQILNQPLAPPTLLLLNQLLQQIKVLQQLHQQHSVQNSLKGNSQTVLQISVQITKTKQQIANLQNQIAVQQATYMKQQQQQQQQQQHPTAPSQSSEYYKTSSVHDPMSALQNSFSDLAMNKEPPVSQQQSRLNQWKLPSLDKDGDIAANEFSRAPGTTSKPLPTPGGLSHTHSSPNMNPLLGQGDGTWSSRLGDSGWPDAGNSDATDGKDWQPGGTAFTDLVPEFEPGKPWKMKNIEDDPSITPGSVVRSLSLAAIKDPDAIFSSSSKTSPPPQSVNADTSIPSLSNSTWSFNPPASTPSAFASSKNTWTDPTPPTYSELWGVPMRARGPPPGLGSKSAGWTSGTWLLLKNLTPQIDGSTLKTLCMQHGPVLDFRLYLNHGIALTKYSTRDEATKAQGALNNCVLGNTTIFAESPVDNEAHTLLHTLSHGGGGGQQQTGGSGNSGWAMRPSKKAGPPPDTWSGSSSQLWGGPPSSNSLWSNSGIDSGDTQRTTPSSLNLYLPGDLLGGRDGIGSW